MLVGAVESYPDENERNGAQITGALVDPLLCGDGVSKGKGVLLFFKLRGIVHLDRCSLIFQPCFRGLGERCGTC